MNAIRKYYILSAWCLVSFTSSCTLAQSDEAQQLLLNWEKLKQLEKILDNLYKSYKILDKGYSTIRDISKGNYSLHKAFIDGLMLVNPTIRNYKRIPLIIDYQKLLINEYQRANRRFKQDPNLTIDELEYLGHVYKHLFDASVRNIDDLMMIITATKLSMSDDERMHAIDNIFDDMENKLVFLRTFNNNTQLLAIQRARSMNDVRTMRLIYGVN